MASKPGVSSLKWGEGRKGGHSWPQRADGSSLLDPETVSQALASLSALRLSGLPGPSSILCSPDSFWFPQRTHSYLLLSTEPHSPSGIQEPPQNPPSHSLSPQPPWNVLPLLLPPALCLTGCPGAEAGPPSSEGPQGSGPEPGGQRYPSWRSYSSGGWINQWSAHPQGPGI